MGTHSGTGEGFSEEEADCIAAALVDVVGVEELEAAGAWDRIQDDPDGSLADFGITLDESQSSTLFDGMNECKDMRAYFEETLTTEGLPPELSACVLDGIDDATLQRIIMAGFTEGDAGLDAEADLTAAVEQAASECAAAGAA
jgi:hypothetical protein